MGRKLSPSLPSVLASEALMPFLFLHIAIFVAHAVGEIPLQQLPIWTQIDVCAQSCALSASSYFSSSLQCPGSDPASCLCTLGPTTRLAGLAHVCASNSCKSYPSYSADPERARAALTTYCVVNAAQSSDAGTSSNPAPISISETLPSQTESLSQATDSQKTSSLAGTSTFATITSTPATISQTTTTGPEASLIVVTTYTPSASLTDSNSISSTATSASPQSSTAPDLGFSRSDQIAIGIGVPATFFALVGLFLMWKQRKGPFAGQQIGVQHIRLNDRE